MEHGQLAPPPASPELPERALRYPAWPWWYALAAFVGGIVPALLIVAVISGVAGVEPGDTPPPWVLIVGTLIQNALLLCAALLLARQRARPRGWHLGLRGTPAWPALGWAVLGMVVYYVVSAIYGQLVHIDAEQQVTTDIGAENGTSGLLIAGLMVVIAAPILEELFWRGFVFRALRTGLPVVGAAVTAGVVFGLIHFNVDDPGWDELLLVLPLGLLGTLFCLIYEKTGSLFPCIGLHAFNNSVAFAATVDGGWQVTLPAGMLMIAACFLVPRLLTPVARPAPA